MKQLVWNRGEKKDNKNEEILKPVSKTIVPGNEQCQSFQKIFSKLKTDSHYVVRMTIGGLHYSTLHTA